MKKDQVSRSVLFLLLLDPAQKSIKVGIEAQSPAGEGGMRYYSDIKLEKKTVANLRAGV